MGYRNCISIIIVLLLTSFCMADDPGLDLIDESVPTTFSEAVKDVEFGKAIAVSMDGKLSVKIWLRESLKPATNPSSELGVTFGKIETGSFVGVVEMVDEWTDYKMNPIKPGCYTMRYGIMPADGNHMGVSSYRDYLLLIPASLDQDPAKGFGYDDLVISSFEATGTPHPAVLALYPIWEDVSEPKLVKNDLDQWTIGIKIGDDTLGLTIQGHGEIH